MDMDAWENQISGGGAGDGNRWLPWVVMVIVFGVAVVLVKDTQYVPDEFRILQSGFADFNPDMLKERSPLVLQDGVTDAHILLATCFRYTYLWATDIQADAGPWRKSISKYVIVHNASSSRDASVWVAHPKEMTGHGVVLRPSQGSGAFLIDTGDVSIQGERKYVEIVLHPCQSLVVPCNWGWRRNGDKDGGAVREIALTDLTYAAVACVKRVMCAG
jgi:hypothetical protein